MAATMAQGTAERTSGVGQYDALAGGEEKRERKDTVDRSVHVSRRW